MNIQVSGRCPRCSEAFLTEVTESSSDVRCPSCDWVRSAGSGDFENGVPTHCLVCGCQDLWRQKDFPQGLGLTLVVIGATLSTIAWAYMQPVWAIGILMAFGLVDLLLFLLMRDVLVCYRCRSVHRRAPLDESHPRFDLETAERYRQEAKRLEESNK